MEDNNRFADCYIVGTRLTVREVRARHDHELNFGNRTWYPIKEDDLATMKDLKEQKFTSTRTGKQITLYS